jgi:hypothetical protein
MASWMLIHNLGHIRDDSENYIWCNKFSSLVTIIDDTTTSDKEEAVTCFMIRWWRREYIEENVHNCSVPQTDELEILIAGLEFIQWQLMAS